MGSSSYLRRPLESKELFTDIQKLAGIMVMLRRRKRRREQQQQEGGGFASLFATVARRAIPAIAKIGRKAIPIAKRALRKGLPMVKKAARRAAPVAKRAAKRAAQEVMKEGARQLPRMLLSSSSSSAGVKGSAHGNNKKKRSKRNQSGRGAGLLATAVIEGITQAVEAGLIMRKQPERYRGTSKDLKHTFKRGNKKHTYIIRSSGVPKMGW